MGHLGNYLTTQEMTGAYKITGMRGMGCGPCKAGMAGLGAVPCGGECGERLWDDPDRMMQQADPTVGGPETPIYNISPNTDAGPENNDWAIDGGDGMGDFGGMLDWVKNNKGMALIAALGIGFTLHKLGLVNFKK